MTFVMGLTLTLSIAQYSNSHKQQIQTLSELPVQSMPLLNNQALQFQEENRRTHLNQPAHFAHSVKVNFDPEHSGTWETIGKKAIWRLVIESKGAFSLNLGFSKFQLPSSGQLYIYDFDGKEKLRPFVAADNEEHEQLWAPLISGDKLVIEVNVDIEEKDDMRLNLNYVNHDFMNIQKSISDACHIDVKCGEANGYPDVEDFRNQIRSVGLFTLEGVSICTGFLVNNTRQDCRPYFMTANHCNVNQGNVASMVTYWNFENSYCRLPGSYDSAEPGDGRFSQFNSGAMLRANWQESDFTLVEMDDEIPDEANAYFCGWDISSNPPARGIVIHHPNLEEKRISFKYSPLYHGFWGQEATPIANGNHLIVDSWDLGSTDDGSSGAPLFNRNGFVVGQLRGGLADCGNSEYDAFGAIFASWIGGGQPSNRLKDWLDPDDKGVLIQEGRNCSLNIELSENNFTQCSTDGFFEVEVSVGSSFKGQVELTFEALPNGAFAFFNTAFVNPGQTAILTVTNIQNLAKGAHSLTIVAKDLVMRQQVELNFTMETSLANVPSLVSPVDRTTIDVTNPFVEWSEDPMASNYILQLATDLNFTENENNYDIVESSFNLSDILNTDQVYYWRVRSVNTCGESDWSNPRQFLAIALSCQLVESIEAIDILEESPNTIFSTISVDSPGSIVSVEVSNISGKHSFVSDLRFSLISPKGTEIMLLRDKCSSTRDFNIGFADDGLIKIDCPLENREVYKPIESFESFVGESAKGDWQLKVEDKNTFDGGSLDSWTIEICLNTGIDYSLSGDLNTINICTNESYNIPLIIGNSFENSGDLFFETNIPNLVRVDYSDGEVNILVNPTGMILPGNYPAIIKVNDAFNNTAEYFLDVIVVDRPMEFALLSPADQIVYEEENLNFDWSLSTFAQEYIFEVALEENFENVIVIDTIEMGSISIQNNFDAAEIYYWKVTARNRCGFFESEVRSFTTDKVNSVSNTNSTFLNIYPNPAKDYIHLFSAEKNLSQVDLQVQSVDGKLMTDGPIQFENNLYTIPLRDWAPGVYIISAFYQSQVQVSRFVVQ